MQNAEQIADAAVAPLFVKPTSWDETKALQIETTKLLQEHELRIALCKYTSAHGSVDPTRPARWYIDQVEAPGSETTRKYMGRGKKVFDKASPNGADVWGKLEESVGSIGSWFTGRAALQYYLMFEMRRLKRVIDGMHSPDADGPEVIKALELLPRLSNALVRIPSGKPAKFQPGSEFKPVRLSKSLSARKAPPDWRERVARELPKKYKPFWLIQCASGCRPQELANGVEVHLSLDGKLDLTVAGAKLGKHAGQRARRMLFASSEGGVVQMLAAGLKPNMRATARLQCKVDTYCKAVSRCCRKVFPNLDTNKLLSAYSARHQRKADWKRAGMNRVDLAKGLGHRTTRSAVYYGSGVTGSAGAVKPIAVRATNEVKARPAFVATSAHSARESKAGRRRAPRRPKPK